MKKCLVKYGDKVELSYHINDLKYAKSVAKKYNQVSIWDCKNCNEIFVTDTGKIGQSLIEEFQKVYKTREQKEELLSSITNEEIDMLIDASTNINGKFFYSTFKK